MWEGWLTRTRRQFEHALVPMLGQGGSSGGWLRFAQASGSIIGTDGWEMEGGGDGCG